MKHLEAVLLWFLTWRILSNSLFIGALVIAHGGDTAGAILFLAIAILTRLWHQEELKEKEKCSARASKPLN